MINEIRQDRISSIANKIRNIRVGQKSGCLTIIELDVNDSETYDKLIEEDRVMKERELQRCDSPEKAKEVSSHYEHYIEIYEKLKKVKKIKCKCKCGREIYMLAPYFFFKRHNYCDTLNNYMNISVSKDVYAQLINDKNATADEEELYSVLDNMPYSFFHMNIKECGLKEQKRERVRSSDYDYELPFKNHATLVIEGYGKDKEELCKAGRKEYYVIYRTFKCRCKLCGKEYEYRYKDFEIEKSDGYYSLARCNCRDDSFFTAPSSFEWRTMKFFREYGIEYEAEVSFPDLIGAGHKYLLRYDFAVYENGKIKALIECQGAQHYRKSEDEGFGGEPVFRLQQLNDEKKRAYAQEKGLKLIEISYKQNTYEKEKLYLLGELNMIDELAKEVRKQMHNRTK